MTAIDNVRDYASDLRPDTWDEVCGQQMFVGCLKRFCITGRPPKAIMFIGAYGTGNRLGRRGSRAYRWHGGLKFQPRWKLAGEPVLPRTTSHAPIAASRAMPY